MRFTFVTISFTLLLVGTCRLAFGQFVYRDAGSNCVGENNRFRYSGPSCTTFYWEVPEGDYTIISQDNLSIVVVWHEEIEDARVVAHYSGCPGNEKGAAISPSYSMGMWREPVVLLDGPGGNICPNSSAYFVATPFDVDVDDVISFLWRVNEVEISNTTNSSFVATNLQNGDVVDVIMHTLGTCVNYETFSDPVVVDVLDRPNVQVSVSAPPEICEFNEGVAFEAEVVNGGDHPTYTWLRNGVPATDRLPGYPPNVYIGGDKLEQGDAIKVRVDADLPCALPLYSSPYVVDLTPGTPEVSIEGLEGLGGSMWGEAFVCQGDTVSLVAEPLVGAFDEGSLFQWKVDGVDVSGDTELTIVGGVGQGLIGPGSIVTLTVTGMVGGDCLIDVPATASTEDIMVNMNPPIDATLVPSGSKMICSTCSEELRVTGIGGGSVTWSKDDIVIPAIEGGTENPIMVSEPGIYSVHAKVGPCETSLSEEFVLSKNAGPIADAGDDKLVQFPDDSIILMGSGSDSDGQIVSYHWQKESGPDDVILTGVDSPSLQVNGLKPGHYTFSLTVTDDFGEASPGDYVSVSVQSFNYIKESTIMVAGVHDTDEIDVLNIGDKDVNVTYFDGLGRPAQMIHNQGSPGRKDVIQPIVYDEFGRESRKLLPFVGTGSKGNFVVDAPVEQLNFYTRSDSGAEIAGDDFPYAVTIYEASPLNRVLEQGAAGEAWQPGTGNTVKRAYRANAVEEVRLWSYIFPTGARPLGLIESSGYYLPNRLFKNVTTDEHGYDVIEYVDLEGRTVLKRVQAVEDPAGADAPAINDTNFASTYYIYNDFGSLVCVIQPEGVRRIGDYLSGTASEKEEFLQKWAFRYRYDGRRRMIIKQVPGAEPVYLIYDIYDRLVLMQDGNQRALTPRQWTFTKYDAFNRVALTGIYYDTAALEPDAMQSTVNSFYATTLPDQRYEEFRTESENIHGYTNRSFPDVSTEGDYLTVTYYESYGFTTLAGSAFDYKVGVLTGQEPANFDRVKGLVTGSKVKVLGQSDFRWNATYYDGKYRVIQTVSTNALGKVDRTTHVLDFPGRIRETVTVHNEEEAGERSVRRKFDYDHGGRLVKTWHAVDENDFVLLADNSYNELGQVVTRSLHSDDGPVVPDEQRSFHQALDYRYNIRGWLTQINDTDDPDRLFSLRLGYEAPAATGASAQYNGNISELQWRSGGMDRRGYGFGYDALNRLVDAGYHDFDDPSKNGRYDETISDGGGLSGYDLNGNINRMVRKGRTGVDGIGFPVYGTMDDLSYDYSGNQLMRVTDGGSDDEGFIDGNPDTDDYAYDENGNMYYDRNKGMDGTSTASGESRIDFNHLNLPSRVAKNTGEYIVYTYDATGVKLRQDVYEPGNSTPVKTTIYAGEFHYENGGLKFIHHDEGRIVMADGVPEYQYHLKDHLGNVRVTFTTTPETDAETATFEEENEGDEYSKFIRYQNARRVRSEIVDRTNGATQGYAQRLSGGLNERFGIGRSLSVMPGDTVRAEVYAKYIDPESLDPEIAEFLGNLLEQIVNGTTSGGMVIDGSDFGSSTVSFPFPGEAIENTEGSVSSGPRAYLNWLVFDRDYNWIKAESGYVRLTDAAKESGDDVPHERLFSPDIVIDVPGYVYIYLSNEEETPLEVYFDDFTVEHVKSPVVQMDDYYPFGLTFNSYSRENTTPQDFKYNGKEEQNELRLGWLDYGARMYQPEIGRFFTQDRFSEKYLNYTTYQYGANNPVKFIDVNGDSLWIKAGSDRALYENGKLYNADGTTYAGRGVRKDGSLRGFLKKTVSALNQISESSATGTALVRDLQGSENSFTIERGTENSFTPDNAARAAANLGELSSELSALPKGGSGGIISFNPNQRLGGPDVNGNRERPAWLGLAHELFHGSDSNRGILHLANDYSNSVTGFYYSSTREGLLKAEISAVTQENQLRNETGMPLRQYYGVQNGSPSGPRLVPFFLQYATYLYR